MSNQDWRACSYKKCHGKIDLARLDLGIRIFAFGEDYSFCNWVCVINWWNDTHGGKQFVTTIKETKGKMIVTCQCGRETCVKAETLGDLIFLTVEKPPIMSEEFGDMSICYSCRRVDGSGEEAIHQCLNCGKPLCLKCSFYANDHVPTGPYCGKCG